MKKNTRMFIAVFMIAVLVVGMNGGLLAAETEAVELEETEEVGQSVEDHDAEESVMEEAPETDAAEEPRTEEMNEEDEDLRSRPAGVQRWQAPTEAFSDEPIAEEESVGESSFPADADLDIRMEDVISVAMPLVPEDAYNFVLDPQDLLSRYGKFADSYERSSLYFTNRNREKAHTGISDAAVAKNKSSVPVLLYVELQIENDGNWPVTYTDMDSVEKDYGNNIAFSIIPVSEEENGGGLVQHAESRVSVDETGRAEAILFLPGSEDNFDRMGDKLVAKEDAVWSSAGFCVQGACNKTADWEEIFKQAEKNSGKLKIRITYRMSVLTDEQKEMMINGDHYDPASGLVSF